MQGGQGLRLQKDASAHDRQGVQHHPLLADDVGERRHGAWLDAADIGVMAAGGDEEGGLGRALGREHRHDHGDVGQMGAPGIGVIECEGLARFQRRMSGQHGAHAGSHGAQMHRHVGGVGDQSAAGVEQGAGKIQPLLDVHRACGALQGRAHGLGDSHEAPVEKLQGHRIGAAAHQLRGRAARHARQSDHAVGASRRAPSGGQPDLGVAAHNQQRTVRLASQVIGHDNARPLGHRGLDRVGARW